MAGTLVLVKFDESKSLVMSSLNENDFSVKVTGCVGVPLYRIYPRKTAWRTEKPEV